MKKKIWTARILASILIWDAIGMGWNGNGIPVRGAQTVWAATASDSLEAGSLNALPAKQRVSPEGDFEAAGGVLTKYLGKSANVVIPAEIGGEAITKIGTDAFNGNETLGAVVVPEGVEVLERGAFANCRNLKDVTLPHSLRTIKSAFGSSGIEKIVIPEGVETLNGSFFGCVELKDVTLPNSLREIGAQTFQGCEALEKVVVPEGVTTIGNSAFATIDTTYPIHINALKEVELPDSLETIEASAFYYCENLKKINIPPKVKEIKDRTFYHCNSLEPEFSEGLEVIRSQAFLWANIEKELIFPESLTMIEDGAFNAYQGYYVTIPENVTRMRFDDFTENKSISEGTSAGIKIMGDPEITAKYGQYEYSVVIYSEEDAARVREFCQDHNVAWAPLSQYPPDQERFSEEEDFVIKDGVLVEYKGDAPTVVIPGGVTAIGDSVFKGKNLRSVWFPRSLKSIGVSAFENCEHLSGLIFYPGLESIGDSAFKNCKGFWHLGLDLPDSLKSIGNGAFQGCEGLLSIKSEGRLERIGKGAFLDCPDLSQVELLQEKEFNIQIAEDAFSLTDSSRLHFVVNFGSVPEQYAKEHGIPYRYENEPPKITASMLHIGNTLAGETMRGPSIHVPSLGDITLFEFPLAGDGDSKLAELLQVKCSYDLEEDKLYVVIGDEELLEDADSDDETAMEKLFHSIKEATEALNDADKVKDMAEKADKLETAFKKLYKNEGIDWTRRAIHPMNIGLEFEPSFCGYMEVDLGREGAVPAKGTLIAMLPLDMHAGLGWPEPVSIVMVTAGLEVNGSGQVTAKVDNIYKVNMVEIGGQVKLEITPYVTVGAGIEPGSDILDLTARLQGSLDTALAFPVESLEKSLEVSLSAEFSLTGHLLGAEGELYKSDWKSIKLYPRPKEDAVSTYTAQEGGLHPIDKSYRRRRSGFVFPYAKPQIASFADGTLIKVWEDDVPGREDMNSTAVFYSLYSGGNWSQPVIVSDDGTADYEPKVTVDGNQAYILWQNLEQRLAPDASVEEQAGSCELQVAVYDKTSDAISRHMDVTDKSSRYKYQARVAAFDGKIYVTWLEKDTDDLFAGKSYTAKGRLWAGGAWEDEAVIEVFDEGTELYTLLPSFIGGEPAAAYGRQTVNGDEEFNEVRLYYQGQNTAVAGTDTLCRTLAFEQEESGTRLYGIQDYHLIQIDMTGTGEVLDTGLSIPGPALNPQWVGGPNGKAVIWEMQEGLHSNLYGAYYDEETGTWGDGIALTDVTNSVTEAQSGAILPDGTLMLGYRLTEDGQNSGLITEKLERECDLAITALPWLEAMTLHPGMETVLHVEVENTGSLSAPDGFRLELFDGSQSFEGMDPIEYPLALAPGQKTEVEIAVTLPNELAGKRLKAKVTPLGGIKDKNSKNNTSKELKLALVDFVIAGGRLEGDTGNRQLAFDIANAGCATASNASIKLQITMQPGPDDGDNTFSKTVSIASLGVNEKKTVTIPMKDLKLHGIAIEELLQTTYLNIKISSDAEENSYANNLMTMTYTADVSDGIKAIRLDRESLNMAVGEETSLSGVIQPLGLPERFRKLTWTSEDEDIATVSYDETDREHAVVTAVNPGTTVIRAKFHVGDYDITAKCTVEVREEADGQAAVTGVELNTESLVLEEGGKARLLAHVLPVNADDTGLFWESADDSIAAVSESGEVEAIACGGTEIHVSSQDGGFTRSCMIQVIRRTETPAAVNTNVDKVLRRAREAAEEALQTFEVSNETTGTALLEAVRIAVEDVENSGDGTGTETGKDVKIEWQKEPVVTPATKETEGAIRGVVMLTLGGKHVTVEVVLSIPKLNDSGEPGEEPGKPGTEPEEPEKPGTGPEEPGAEPEEPEKPGAEPEEPEKPGTGPEEPEKPGTEPEEPEKPGAEPEEPEKPGVEPEKPEKPGTEPEEPEKPGEGSNKPGRKPSASGAGHYAIETNAHLEGQWRKDEIGWWYQYSDGSYPVSQWVCLTWNGTPDWYYFHERGYLYTGWLKDGGYWYYLHLLADGRQGYMYTGWRCIDGRWYEFNSEPNGRLGILVDEDGKK